MTIATILAPDAGLPSIHVLAGGVAGWDARGLELDRAPAGAAPRDAQEARA